MTERWRELFDEARTENGRNNAARAGELVSLAIRAAEHVSPESRSYSDAQASFALWYFLQERYAEAEVFQQRYIEAETRLGIGDRELGNILKCLAEMQQKQGKLAEAKATIEKAISVYPAEYLPELADAKRELSKIFEESGDQDAAQQCRGEAMELRRKWDKIVAERAKTLQADRSNRQ